MTDDPFEWPAAGDDIRWWTVVSCSGLFWSDEQLAEHRVWFGKQKLKTTWNKVNGAGKDVGRSGRSYRFRDPQHAMLFKLTFGGSSQT